MSIDPTYFPALVMLALIHVRQRKFADAFASFSESMGKVGDDDDKESEYVALIINVMSAVLGSQPDDESGEDDGTSG